MRTLISALLITICGPAWAQHSQYHYPVELASLENHLQLQFEYARPGSDPTVHRTVLSVEGQYVIADRLELALNVPFLYYTFAGSEEPTVVRLEPAQVGDFILGLKTRVFRGQRLAVAVFLDTRLPVHSGLGDRNNATFQLGGAVALTFPRAVVGGTLELLWFLRTVNEDLGTKGYDVAHIGLSLYGVYRVIGPLHARLALQFYNAVHPSGDLQVFGITPGLELQLPHRVSLQLAARIAPTTDSSDLFSGRAGLLLSGSWLF